MSPSLEAWCRWWPWNPTAQVPDRSARTMCSVQLRIGSLEHHCFQAGCIWMHVTSLSPVVKVQGCPFRGASGPMRLQPGS